MAKPTILVPIDRSQTNNKSENSGLDRKQTNPPDVFFREIVFIRRAEVQNGKSDSRRSSQGDCSKTYPPDSGSSANRHYRNLIALSPFQKVNQRNPFTSHHESIPERQKQESDPINQSINQSIN
jgi:hypothetical protein